MDFIIFQARRLSILQSLLHYSVTMILKSCTYIVYMIVYLFTDDLKQWKIDQTTKLIKSLYHNISV